MRPSAALISVLAVLLVAACDYSLDTAPRQCVVSTKVKACLEAPAHPDLKWLQDNIFTTNCSGKDCHGTPDPGHELGGKFSLAEGSTYTSLMGDGAGVASRFADGRTLVVPGEPDNSYLVFMLRGVAKIYGDPPYTDPPSDVGYMPQKSATLCCQKIDAVRHWIEDGALPQ